MIIIWTLAFQHYQELIIIIMNFIYLEFNNIIIVIILEELALVIIMFFVVKMKLYNINIIDKSYHLGNFYFHIFMISF